MFYFLTAPFRAFGKFAALAMITSLILVVGFFFALRTYSEEKAFRDEAQYTEAVITSEKSGKRSARNIKCYYYDYRVGEESLHGKDCQRLENPLAEFSSLEIGQTVSVAYLPGNPANSRIVSGHWLGDPMKEAWSSFLTPLACALIMWVAYGIGRKYMSF